MIFDTGIEENLIRATIVGANLKARAIEANGRYFAKTDDDCDGYSMVEVDVRPNLYTFPEPINTNGIYIVPAGYDGFDDFEVDVSSAGLENIIKLPTYANYKFGDFEYLFKVGAAISKRRQILFSTYGNETVIQNYAVFDDTYIVICEKNVPVVAYENNEWNKKEESYSYGKLYSTTTYSGQTVSKNVLDGYDWSLAFERTRTTVYVDGGNPDVYVTKYATSATANPFRYYRTIFTSLTDASLKDFAQRLHIALNSLS